MSLLSRNPRKLWRRYALAIALVVASVTASHFASTSTTALGDDYATAINISGRQRMLSQRILYFSNSVMAEEQQSAASRHELRQAVALFETSHGALIEGGNLGLTAELASKIRDIYFTSEDGTTLNEDVLAFIRDANQVASGNMSTEPLSEVWARMQRQGPNYLLSRLNDAVFEIESRARGNISQMKLFASVAFWLAIALLIVEAIFIFWPAQVSINNAIDKLAERNRELSGLLEREKLAREEAETANQAAITASEVKSQFIANMSHELRTPLNGVVGMLDILQHDGLPKDQADKVDIAQQSAHSLLSLLTNILDQSKLDRGTLQPVIAPYSPAEIISEIVELNTAAAEGKALSLRSEVDRALPPALSGDGVRIKQVLQNLVLNALKFTNAGEIILSGRYVETSRGADKIRFEVSDTGIGLTDEVRSRLFQRFYQGDNSDTREFGGAGIGLSLCQQLVTLMDGEIGADDLETGGSRFWFEIPAETPAKKPNRRAAIA